MLQVYLADSLLTPWLKNQTRVVLPLGCGYFCMEPQPLESRIQSQKAVFKNILIVQQKGYFKNNDCDYCSLKSPFILRYYWTNVLNPSKHIYQSYKLYGSEHQ